MLPIPDVFNLMGACLSLSYALPLAGGLLSQYVVSLPVALRGSLILILLSSGVLMMGGQDFLILALTLFACGNGLFKPLVPLVLDRWIGSSSHERPTVYTRFYGVLNVGSFLGFICCGFVTHFYGPAAAFALPFFAIFLACLLSFKKMDSEKTPFSSLALYFLILSALIGLVMVYLHYLHALGFVFPLIMMGTISVYGIIYYRASLLDRVTIRHCYGYAACVMSFITMAEQATSSIILFMEHFLQREIVVGVLGQITFPVVALKALDPFVVIILVFGLNYAERIRNKTVFQQIQQGYGALILVFGILVGVASAASYSATKMSVYWILPVFILMAMAELSVLPRCLGRLLELTPPHLKGFFAPLWSLSISYGAFLSGKIATFSFGHTASEASGFALIYGICLGMVVIMSGGIFWYRLKKE